VSQLHATAATARGPRVARTSCRPAEPRRPLQATKEPENNRQQKVGRENTHVCSQLFLGQLQAHVAANQHNAAPRTQTTRTATHAAWMCVPAD
jgi:hypothetical protein